MPIQTHSGMQVRAVKKNKTIKVDCLARVEGEGAISVRIKDNRVVDVKLNIFEPPRFFEAFLRGRSYGEAPDITSRICGICPIAYQMSAVHAMEDLFGIKVGGQLRALRRLIYCGEWIESHALHVYLLHAPDFLGYESAIHMAKDYPELVKRGLQLKKVGNEIVALIGGREIHPINVRVGGFYKVPTKRELDTLKERLLIARDFAQETVGWTATLPFPDFEQDYEFVALRHPREYPFNEGRLVSNKGLDVMIEDYDKYFEEEHLSHSNALHSRIKNRGAYLVGPLARYNLNFDRLPRPIQEAALSAGLPRGCCNPFKSIIARSVEILYACNEALCIIDEYETPDKPTLEIETCEGTGYGCTEAPRGILYHRYSVDGNGIIKDARIVPPTSQNQKMIEEDLHRLASDLIDLPDDRLRWICEQAVRNYDPCISCATHLIEVDIKRD